MQDHVTKQCAFCDSDFQCTTSGPGQHRVYCTKKCQSRARDQKLKDIGPATHIVVTKKYCSVCKETRPAGMFFKDKLRVDGLKPWCKPCTSGYHKDRYDPQYEVDRRERLKQDPEWVEKERLRSHAKMLKAREQRESESHLPKVCATCGDTKTRGDFSLNYGFKDGLLNHCKECSAAKRRADYEANAEERRKKANARYASDINIRQRAANSQRRWRIANREKADATRKAYYEAHREEIAEKRRQKYESKQDWLARQKEGRVCYRCGWSDVRCLDWHHVDADTKVFNIGEASANTGLTEDEILFEISKCTTICANCHRIQHWEERQEKKSRRAQQPAST